MLTKSLIVVFSFLLSGDSFIWSTYRFSETLQIDGRSSRRDSDSRSIELNLNQDSTFTLVDKIGQIDPYKLDQLYGTWKVDESHSLILSFVKEVRKGPFIFKGRVMYQDSVRYCSPAEEVVYKIQNRDYQQYLVYGSDTLIGGGKKILIE